MVNLNKFIQQAEKDLYILDKIRTGELDLNNLYKQYNTKLLWGNLNPQLCHVDLNGKQKGGLDFRYLCYKDKTKLLWGELKQEQFQQNDQANQIMEQIKPIKMRFQHNLYLNSFHRFQSPQVFDAD